MTTTNRIPMPPPRPPSGAGKTAPLEFPREPDDSIGERVLVYGPPGAGKTSLCCAAPGPVITFDIEKSLTRQLRNKFSQEIRDNLYFHPVSNVKDLTWTEFIDNFADMDSLSEFKTIVVDSLSVAQRILFDHVAAKYGNGRNEGIESIPYGRGYAHAASLWNTQLLPLATKHTEAGRNIVFVAHSMSIKVANPGGTDFLRAEPQLHKSDKPAANIQGAVFEWLNHCMYIEPDKAVGADGKARGGDARCIYTGSRPWVLAKTRGSAPDTIIPDRENLAAVWEQLFA